MQLRKRIGNGRIRAEKTSIYHGISWRPNRKKWFGRYTRCHVQVETEHFDNQHDAAIALAEMVIARENDIIRQAKNRKADEMAKQMEDVAKQREKIARHYM